MKSRFFALAAVAALLAACQTYPASVGAPAAPTAAAASRVILTGRVQFPGYRVAASESDVARQAVVSLIDPTGVTRAAGVTNAAGEFTLYQSTEPLTLTDGDAFVLEVMKQVATAGGNSWVALRTKLKRTAGAWDSITGPTVVIDAATTAIAKIDDLDAAITVDDLLGVLNGATVTSFGTHGQSEVDALAGVYTGKLSSGADPVGPLVYHGDVTINSDADVATYAPYEVIDGYLRISGSTTTVRLPNLKAVTDFVAVKGADVTTLAFDDLVTIDGELNVDGADSLTSMAGFDRLETVGEKLFLSTNAALESLDGLEHLRSVKDLYFDRNPVLANVHGLSGLTTIADGIMINSHPMLTNLEGLEGLTRIPGSLELGVNLNAPFDFPDPSGLTSLKGLDNLTSVGSIRLADNDALTTLEGGVMPSVGGLAKLTTIEGDLDLYGNALLTDLAGLSGVTGAIGHLGIFDTALHSLTGLGGITRVNELNFQDNANLTSVNAMANYASGSYLFIYNNPALVLDCGQPFPKVQGSALTPDNYQMVDIHDNGGDASTCAKFGFD